MNSFTTYNPTGSSGPYYSQQTNYTNQPRKMAYTPTNSDHLNTILDSVASQIQQLDQKVKWKLELTIIDDQPRRLSKPHQNDPTINLPPQPPQPSSSTTPQTNSGHRSSTSSASEPHNTKGPETLAITSRTQYPWDFTIPLPKDKSTLSSQDTEELQQQLKESYDRQKHLQEVICAQSEQISRSYSLSNDAEHAITTMRSIYLTLDNEQKLRYTTEIKLQQKEIEMLGVKLRRLNNILRTTESIHVSPDASKMEKDDLLLERQQLLRKLHLYELRLSARDIELNYITNQHEQHQQQQQQQLLQQMSPSSLPLKRYSSSGGRGTSSSPDINKAARQSPTPQFGRKGGSSPYLFQQQYSPKLRSNVRPSTTHRHPQKFSGIDSLGFLADQMLSDPDFDHNNSSVAMASSPLKQSTALPTEQQQYPSRTNTQRGPTPSSSASSSTSSHQRPDDKTPFYENTTNDLMTRSKRPISVLSSSFRPVVETTDTIGNRVKLFNVANWTPSEDAQLRKEVLLHGPLGHWGDIASTLPGRTPQQCQERWGMIHSTQSKS